MDKTVTDKALTDIIGYTKPEIYCETKALKMIAAELLARREADRWILCAEITPNVREIVQWSHPRWDRVKEGYLTDNAMLHVWGGTYTRASGLKWRPLPEVAP